MKSAVILKELKSCLYCGKEFIASRKDQKYCCDNHAKYMWKKRNRSKYLKWQRKYDKEKWRKNHPETTVTKTCEYCGKEFTTDTKHKYQKYCNYSCRNKANSTPEKRKRWRKNYRNSNLKEIKKKDNEYKARIRFGAESKTLNRKVVDKRDKRVCQLCGSKKKIVIHHIRYSGKAKDLVTLCRECHASIHQRIKKEPYWD